VPEGLYDPASTSSAAVMVVLVMNRLMRPEQVGVAAIAWQARETVTSSKRQFMAQYSGTFRASAQWGVEKTKGDEAAALSNILKTYQLKRARTWITRALLGKAKLGLLKLGLLALA
jgi:hypothetical protein